MKEQELKNYAIQSKLPLKVVKEIYSGLSSMKCLSSMKTALEERILEEKEKNKQKFITAFINSESMDFNEFIEGLISSDISLDVRPQITIKKSIDDEIEEDLLFDKDDSENLLDIDKEILKNKKLLVNGE